MDSGIEGFRNYELLSAVSPKAISPNPELVDFLRINHVLSVKCYVIGIKN